MRVFSIPDGAHRRTGGAELAANQPGIEAAAGDQLAMQRPAGITR